MGLTKIVNAFQNVSVIRLAKYCLLDLLRRDAMLDTRAEFHL